MLSHFSHVQLFETLWTVAYQAPLCHAAQLAIIKQMSRQVSRGSAGEYQAEEQAGFGGLSWRISGR